MASGGKVNHKLYSGGSTRRVQVKCVVALALLATSVAATTVEPSSRSAMGSGRGNKAAVIATTGDDIERSTQLIEQLQDCLKASQAYEARRNLLASALKQASKKRGSSSSSAITSSSKSSISSSAASSKTSSTATPASTPKAQQSTTSVPTMPKTTAKVDDAETKAAKPAQPVTVLPGEVLPDGLQVQQQKTSNNSTLTLLADTVTVSMRVFQGASIALLAGGEPLIDSIAAVTAAVSGTGAAQWAVQNSTNPNQQKVMTASGKRHLHQQLQRQQQPDVLVTLFLLTTNPQLVVYRLTQSRIALLAADSPATAAAGSTQQTACATEYCSRLIAAGIMIDSSSMKITTVYDFSNGNSNITAAAAARDAQLARSRTLGTTIGVCVTAGIVVLLLLCNARRIAQCWQTRAAAAATPAGKEGKIAGCSPHCASWSNKSWWLRWQQHPHRHNVSAAPYGCSNSCEKD